MQLNDCDFRDNACLISLTTWIVFRIGILWESWNSLEKVIIIIHQFRVFRLIYIISLFTSIYNLRFSFAAIGSSKIFSPFAWTSFERANQNQKIVNSLYSRFLLKCRILPLLLCVVSFLKLFELKRIFSFIHSFTWLVILKLRLHQDRPDHSLKIPRHHRHFWTVYGTSAWQQINMTRFAERIR